MLETVSMTPAFAAGYRSLADWEQTSAVSDGAAYLRELIDSFRRSTDDVRTLSRCGTAFEGKLRVVLDELVEDKDQRPVSAAAAQLALRLAQMLPSNIPAPEVAVDPDGEIALDWMPSRTRMFSISVGDSDRLAYAWLDGSDRAHGVFRSRGAIPRPLLLQLAELTAGASASVRAA